MKLETSEKQLSNTIVINHLGNTEILSIPDNVNNKCLTK